MPRSIARFWPLIAFLLVAGAVAASSFPREPRDLLERGLLWAWTLSIVGLGTYFWRVPTAAKDEELPKAGHVLITSFLLFFLFVPSAYVFFGDAIGRPAAVLWGVLTIGSGSLHDWNDIRPERAWVRPIARWTFFSLATIGIVLPFFGKPYAGFLTCLLAQHSISLLRVPAHHGKAPGSSVEPSSKPT